MLPESETIGGEPRIVHCWFISVYFVVANWIGFVFLSSALYGFSDGFRIIPVCMTDVWQQNRFFSVLQADLKITSFFYRCLTTNIGSTVLQRVFKIIHFVDERLTTDIGLLQFFRWIWKLPVCLTDVWDRHRLFTVLQTDFKINCFSDGCLTVDLVWIQKAEILPHVLFLSLVRKRTDRKTKSPLLGPKLGLFSLHLTVRFGTTLKWRQLLVNGPLLPWALDITRSKISDLDLVKCPLALTDRWHKGGVRLPVNSIKCSQMLTSTDCLVSLSWKPKQT